MITVIHTDLLYATSNKHACVTLTSYVLHNGGLFINVFCFTIRYN